MAKASLRALALVLGLVRPSAAQELGPPVMQPAAPGPAMQPMSPPSSDVPPTTQAIPPADREMATNPQNAEGAPQKKLRWHDTWLIFENLVTAQTLGIGRSFQSANPTYDAALSLLPRFYFYDSDIESYYLFGRIDVTREFTNNDVTTEQGETIIGGAPHGLGATDPTLASIYRRRLAKRGDYETTFFGYLPTIIFPLSKFSMDNGTYLGLGTEARLYHDVPLAGSRSSAFQMLTIGALVGYYHTFTRATTPTNLQLFRVRMDPQGKSVPGDQLVGAAFPEHELRLTARFIVEVAKNLTWWTDLSYYPTWLYSIPNVPIANSASPGGQVQPTANPNPNTYVVVNGIDTSITYDVMSEFSLSLGYNNTEVQPGLDGQRRSIFYSPGALFYFEIIGHLDEMYLTAAGRRANQSNRRVKIR